MQRVRPYKGNVLDDFVAPLQRAGAGPHGSIHVVQMTKPIPLFSARSERVLRTNIQGLGLRQVGWRALFYYGRFPIAIVDCSRSASGAWSHAVAGQAAAADLGAALMVLRRRAPAKNINLIGIFEISDLAMTYLWWIGSSRIFVPVYSESKRPKHLGRVRASIRRRHATRRRRRAPGAGGT
jgi:hypothetical protein